MTTLPADRRATMRVLLGTAFAKSMMLARSWGYGLVTPPLRASSTIIEGTRSPY